MNRTFFNSYKELIRSFLHQVGHDSSAEAESLTEQLYQSFEVEDQHLGDDMFYFPIWEYFEKTVIPHKVAVYKAGQELMQKLHATDWDIVEMRQRLLIHDFSKFSCDEHIAYSSYDFKDNSKNSESAKMNFKAAWNHHKHYNDHHPEHWLAVNRDGTTTPLVMPKYAIMEMVADWIGAGRTYGSTLEEWLPKNIHTFVFHKTTARVLSVMLNNVTELKFKFSDTKVLIAE